MASNIKLNSAGMAKLLKDPGVQADLDRRARQIASAAGPGHEADGTTGRTRARATVRTATAAARRAEATERNLTRSIDAART